MDEGRGGYTHELSIKCSLTNLSAQLNNKLRFGPSSILCVSILEDFSHIDS
jgi:hypothetical protein